jgi:hypothetical protein
MEGEGILTSRMPRPLRLRAWALVVGLSVSACGAEPETPSAPVEPPRPAPPRTREVVDSRSQAATLEQLQDLGYVDATVDPEIQSSGVVEHDPAAAWPGLNFYSSRRDSGARLIDMDGAVVHEWHVDGGGPWQHAELLPDGDVIALVKDHRIARYDRDSKLRWEVRGRFHHDLVVHGDEIFALSRVARKIPELHPTLDLLDDRISVYSLDGELLREYSLLDLVGRSPYRFLLPSVWHLEPSEQKTMQLDLLHTNHIEVFDGSQAHVHPLFAEGHILISIRNLNVVAILDAEAKRFLWIWGPSNVTFQHHPVLLDDGHILLFDNGTEQSRVLEIDPLTYRIVWSYGPVEGFFSPTRGGNQRLPNGNTLITESDTGWVFEVTPEGRTVWRFANPDTREGDRRDAIWRMTRFDPSALPFLARAADHAPQ